MTPGQLVKAVSIALDVPEETVVQHDRNLVVAGLRTKGGRGRSAPMVTPLDAARLLTAKLASIRTKDSVASVNAFEQTVFEPPTTLGERIAEYRERGVTVPQCDEHQADDEEKFFDLAIMSLPKSHNFIEALAALITHASGPLHAGELDQLKKRFAAVIINCEMPYVSASIGRIGTAGSARYRFHEPTSKPQAQKREPKLEKHDLYFKFYGIQQRRSVYGSAIMLLGRAFREGGLSFGTTREAMLDWSSPV